MIRLLVILIILVLLAFILYIAWQGYKELKRADQRDVVQDAEAWLAINRALESAYELPEYDPNRETLIQALQVRKDALEQGHPISRAEVRELIRRSIQDEH